MYHALPKTEIVLLTGKKIPTIIAIQMQVGPETVNLQKSTSERHWTQQSYWPYIYNVTLGFVESRCLKQINEKHRRAKKVQTYRLLTLLPF